MGYQARRLRSAPDAPASKGVQGLNVSLSYPDPSALFRYFRSSSFSPANWNWGHWRNERLDALLLQPQETFEPAARGKILAEAHTIVVDEGPWVYVVHDLNPRALGEGQGASSRRRAGIRT